jgi:cbb3-type cytochrome oxidase maturation protein
MEILILILPIALIISIGAVVCFIKATKEGQFDDLETPAFRILIEEEVVSKKGSMRDQNE